MRLFGWARLAAAVAAAAATVAAAVALFGASGGNESTDDEPSGQQTTAVAGEADDGIPDETLATDELTPAEGEFSDDELAYLTDRVPVGVDPAAILQLGLDACDRIGYLDRHEPDAVAEAVRDGEIPEAEGAVEHLCPEYADLLAGADADPEAEDEG
jgi:hypothetical protein